jgi:hypothetical protein
MTDRWETIGTGTDDETGLPVVYVARERVDAAKRLTVWKLVKRPGKGWYSIGQWISLGRFRRFPEKFGVKLSDSITDQTLIAYADAATR